MVSSTKSRVRAVRTLKPYTPWHDRQRIPEPTPRKLKYAQEFAEIIARLPAIKDDEAELEKAISRVLMLRCHLIQVIDGDDADERFMNAARPEQMAEIRTANKILSGDAELRMHVWKSILALTTSGCVLSCNWQDYIKPAPGNVRVETAKILRSRAAKLVAMAEKLERSK